MRSRILCAFALLLTCVSAHTQAPRVPISVQFEGTGPRPVSGRLLIFMKQGKGDEEVSVDEFHPTGTWVTGIEVQDLAAGQTVQLDASELGSPFPFSRMPEGDWEAQAVLDPDHSYNYSGRGPQDWVGPVVSLPHWLPGSKVVELTLDAHPKPSRSTEVFRARSEPALKSGRMAKEEMTSTSLTAFWGKPTVVRAYVILPPGYAENAAAHFPTVYWTHGFGGGPDYLPFMGAMLLKRMDAGTMPPMIWVMLDESCPRGTHEFADSVNDGPWGKALTTEFIPMLEQRYRMDAKPNGRFLNGHSSGGWATLQLQVNYPEIFGGTWSTSPDPSDFHDFTGPDLYAPHANVYRKPDGTPWPIMRDKGEVVATLEQFTHLEDMLGPYGGQIRSFDYVFSPRSDSGAPEPMFDHVTGDVHPTVIAYWRDHYDLAHIVEKNWAQRGPILKGRIHLIVGTADTFYLDGAAHRFEKRLAALGAEPHFTYIPDRTHFDLYQVGKDQSGMFDRIAGEMYAVARPDAKWKPAAGH